MSKRLDIDALRTLKAVAEQGGVTKAANVLALTQSAVSHKIRRLESSIGYNLLRREPGAPLLTEEGKRLLDYAARIVILHDEAIASISNDPVEGQVRLGITEGIADSHLVPILARFSRSHPSVSAKTHAALSLELIEQLSERHIDVAVLNVFENELAVGDRIVGHEELVWVESSDFTPSGKDPVPYISFDRDCFCREWADRQFNQHAVGRELETVLECRSVIGVQNAVAAGLGVALINRSSMRTDFKVIDLGYPEPPPITTIVRTREGDLSKATVALIDEMVTEIQNQ